MPAAGKARGLHRAAARAAAEDRGARRVAVNRGLARDLKHRDAPHEVAARLHGGLGAHASHAERLVARRAGRHGAALAAAFIGLGEHPALGSGLGIEALDTLEPARAVPFQVRARAHALRGRSRRARVRHALFAARAVGVAQEAFLGARPARGIRFEPCAVRDLDPSDFGRLGRDELGLARIGRFAPAGAAVDKALRIARLARARRALFALERAGALRCKRLQAAAGRVPDGSSARELALVRPAGTGHFAAVHGAHRGLAVHASLGDDLALGPFGRGERGAGAKVFREGVERLGDGGDVRGIAGFDDARGNLLVNAPVPAFGHAPLPRAGGGLDARAALSGKHRAAASGDASAGVGADAFGVRFVAGLALQPAGAVRENLRAGRLVHRPCPGFGLSRPGGVQRGKRDFRFARPALAVRKARFRAVAPGHALRASVVKAPALARPRPGGVRRERAAAIRFCALVGEARLLFGVRPAIARHGDAVHDARAARLAAGALRDDAFAPGNPGGTEDGRHAYV